MRIKLMILSAVATALLGGVAWADETAPIGVVFSVEILTPSADVYIQYHGRLVVKQSIDEMEVEYRWGGTSCGSKILTDSMLAYLTDLSSTPYMLVEATHSLGAGQTKCLVGIRAFNTKYE